MQCSQTTNTVSLHRAVSNSYPELKEIVNPDVDRNLKVD